MVFSQTSHKTQSILKVVEIDRLKPEKSQQVNRPNGVITDGYTEATPSSPVAATSNSEVRPGSRAGYLKLEPLYDSTMFHDSDCEFFQDLGLWCSAPAKEEQVQTIDSAKLSEEKAHNIDTPHTPFSPRGFDAFDTNSPSAQAGFYNTTPVDPLSPSIEGSSQLNSIFPSYLEVEKENKILFPERFLDISSLPVVIGDLVSEKVTGTTPWSPTEPVEWTYNTHNTDYTKMYTNPQNTMPFMYQDQEDSLDLKYVAVIPREVESNDVVISECFINDDGVNDGVQPGTAVQRRRGGLSVDVAARAPSWPSDVISTPDVLSFVVDQLDKEKSPQIMKTKLWPPQETTPVPKEPYVKMESPPRPDYEPITPKSESHLESDNDDTKSHSSKRKRHNSEDSDATYTPHSEQTLRKYKRRKPSVPIQDMILALEGSQQVTKARRGRPPKRRESTVSSVCSVDENSSSTHEEKYRVLRDKNNEASKRSRMNRKLKELQMEQLAEDLEERNKKLKVQADILEDMTKRLKDALMTAIMQK